MPTSSPDDDYPPYAKVVPSEPVGMRVAPNGSEALAHPGPTRRVGVTGASEA